MYELTVSEWFAAAHHLVNFKGKCESLHGHNWKIEVTVRGERLNQAGMLIDFAELKTLLRQALTSLDHAFLNELEAFRDSSPSSENIARYVYDQISRELDRSGLKVVRVSAFESQNCQAAYLPHES